MKQAVQKWKPIKEKIQVEVQRVQGKREVQEEMRKPRQAVVQPITISLKNSFATLEEQPENNEAQAGVVNKRNQTGITEGQRKKYSLTIEEQGT